MTKRHKGLLHNEEVNKVYVDMSKEDELKLKTETCVKCHDLIDDHLRPAMELDEKGNFKSQDGLPYTCRQCGCEIY